MTAEELAVVFRAEKDRLLESYLTGTPATAVSTLIRSMKLDAGQRELLAKTLDQALTDAFYAALLELDGDIDDTVQQDRRTQDEDDTPTSDDNGPIETMGFRFFQNGGRPGARPNEADADSSPAIQVTSTRSGGLEENKLDFSEIDSREIAEQLVEEGLLFKILLFPAELGGKDVTQNTAYVPAGIPEIKDKLTETLIKYVQDGLIDKLTVEPAYKGSSYVPSKIVMKASHSEKKSEFVPTIDIW